MQKLLFQNHIVNILPCLLSVYPLDDAVCGCKKPIDQKQKKCGLHVAFKEILPILDTRISVCSSVRNAQGNPPWILKRIGFESSGYRLISLIGKTKRIAFLQHFSFFFFQFSDKTKKKMIFLLDLGFFYYIFLYFIKKKKIPHTGDTNSLDWCG